MTEQRARVLVVDDVPANIKLLGRALRAEHHVQVATGGLAALRIARSTTPPDLILLDINMPDLDGYEVCARLKGDPLTEGIPVIFITAQGEVQDEVRGLELGAVDYITKPFSLPIVLARARAHLQLKRYRDELERMSTLDGLTGVPNRRRLDEAFGHAIARAASERAPLAVLMIDIDHFKQFNDTYGHLVGDECIREVAQTLCRRVEAAGGVFARYGGEEFTAIFQGIGGEEALRRAEALRVAVAALKRPHSESSTADHVTISVGCAAVEQGERAALEALFEQADERLYKAKDAGRNRARGARYQAGVWRPLSQ